MSGWTTGDRVECDDEPGRVLAASRDRCLVELVDGRTLDLDSRALDPLAEVGEDTEDGSHDWTRRANPRTPRTRTVGETGDRL